MKPKNTSSASALSSERGNKTTQTSVAVAQAWLAKHHQPDCPKIGRAFDVLLDKTLRSIVPDGTMSGILRGLECETRQRAAHLLDDRYLAGNPGLTSATATGNLKKVRRHLAQAIYAAVNYSRQQIVRREERITAKHHWTDNIDSFDQRVVVHPCERRYLWALPVDLQIQLVYAGLGLAVRENSLPRETAEMIRTMIEENCSVSEIARRIKISPQAAHKRIRRAGDYLKKFIDGCEFPN